MTRLFSLTLSTDLVIDWSKDPTKLKLNMKYGVTSQSLCRVLNWLIQIYVFVLPRV